jgi:hypothetical protein
MNRLCGILLLLCALFQSEAFTVLMHRKVIKPLSSDFQNSQSLTRLHMGFFGGDEDAKKLTRDNEPEQYFATNTDKMSDQEKIPIAVGGLLFISLPFILGLIALYASK